MSREEFNEPIGVSWIASALGAICFAVLVCSFVWVWAMVSR